MTAAAEVVQRWYREEERDGVAAVDRSFFTPSDRPGLSVLLVHGGGGSPADLRALADDLAAHGHACLCPLLPAHGRGPIRLGEMRFDDVIVRAEEALDALREAPVLVAQSLGAVVGVRLAARRPLAGFVALAPALRPFVTMRALVLLPLALVRPRLARATFRWQMEAKRGIREALEEVPRVECPLLVLHSDDDGSVSIAGARMLYDGAASKDKRMLVLARQGHVLSCAPEPEKVFGPVRSFVENVSADQFSGS